MDNGDPFRLLDVLSSHDVPFVVIGGHAVTFHGFVRATEDTDVVVWLMHLVPPTLAARSRATKRPTAAGRGLGKEALRWVGH